MVTERNNKLKNSITSQPQLKPKKIKYFEASPLYDMEDIYSPIPKPFELLQIIKLYNSHKILPKKLFKSSMKLLFAQK